MHKLTVFKYPLSLKDGPQLLHLPVNAKLLRVACQNEKPNIWALVDPYGNKEVREFVVIGTGYPVPENAQYIGSCDDRIFVWHVFELK